MPSNRTRHAFGAQHLERVYEDRPRVRGIDDIVEVAALRCDIRVSETLDVFADQLVRPRGRVFRIGNLVAEDDLDGPGRTHHRDLRSRPRDVEIGADVFGIHDV